MEVPLRKEVLHLDCALSLVREGLMIVCEEALPDGIPEPLKSWHRISVPCEDLTHLAVNGLPVNEQVYITEIYCQRATKAPYIHRTGGFSDFPEFSRFF